MAKPTLLLLPGGLNETVISKIHDESQGQGQIWKDVMSERSTSHYYCLVCDYAHEERHKKKDVKMMKRWLELLLQTDNDATRCVDVRIWQMGDPGLDVHLERCDLFYMAGGRPDKFQQLFRDHAGDMAALRDRTLQGKFLYVGGCGGAVAVGRYYAPMTDNMLGLIPCMVAIAANASEAREQMNAYSTLPEPLKSCEVKMILTKQTGFIAHGNNGQGFVLTKTGAWKHKPLADAATAQWMKLSAPPPPPPPPVVVAAPPPPLPGDSGSSQSPLPPAAASQYQLERVTYHYQAASTVHSYSRWTPFVTPTENVALVYIPAADEVCNSVPISSAHFTGKELVFSPILAENHGKYPWKNEVEAWLFEWVASLQMAHASDTKWVLMGFSRGAAWGLKLSAQLRFDRVLLVASYMIPQWDYTQWTDIENALIQKYTNNDIMFLYGGADPWRDHASCKQVKALASDHFRLDNTDNCGHEGSKTHAMTAYLSCLVKFA